MPRRLALALALLLATGLGAQEKQKTAPFVQTIEVRVTNVDVVVTGKDGKPVTGLTKDDFELLENGKPREITNFTEVHEMVATAVTTTATVPVAAPVAQEQVFRPRMIAILLDEASLHPFRRNAIFPFLRQFLDQTVRRGDQVIIATWAQALVVEQPMTSDLAAAKATVETISTHATYGSLRAAEKDRYRKALLDLIALYAARTPPEQPPYLSGLGEARGYALSVTHQERRKEEALRSFLSALRGFEGRKVLVYVTEKFSSNPAEEAFTMLDSMKDLFNGGISQNPLIDAREFENTHLISEVAEIANASNITLYPIDAAGKEADLDVLDASEVRLLRNSNTLLPQGDITTINAVAEATGGRALAGSTNWRLAFDTITNDLTSYYSLGFRATNERIDKISGIKVRVKGRNLTVRTRGSLVEKSAASEMSDSVAANLFYPPAKNDLNIRVAADGPKLTITIPTESLTLVPDGTDLTGSFSIFGAFLRGDGAVSKIDQQKQQFRFPAGSLKRRKEITVKLDVKADEKTDAISVGVMDDLSHATGFGTARLTPPTVPAVSR